jgi:hypothetical protein
VFDRCNEESEVSFLGRLSPPFHSLLRSIYKRTFATPIGECTVTQHRILAHFCNMRRPIGVSLSAPSVCHRRGIYVL